MRIAWVVSGPHLESSPAGLYSYLASYRYRMIIPADELEKRGHRVSVIALQPGAPDLSGAVREIGKADVAVFAKVFDTVDPQFRLVQAARKAGVRTVADVCDDNFTDNEKGALRRAVVAAADVVTVSSTFLAGRVLELAGIRARIILDPFEGARGAPRWNPSPRLRVLWFGQIQNLAGLELSLRALTASGIPMRLTVVTRLMQKVHDWREWIRPKLAPGIELELREWSLEATAQSLMECDLVLLPVDRTKNFYLSKGPNRVVDSLWAGRPVVTHRIPAYEEFSEWAWVGDDVAAGLAWTIAQPSSAITGRIERAQVHIAAKYSPQAIGESWHALLTEARAA